eukprot:1047473-Alexandrium_andersonii.AAC.1
MARHDGLKPLGKLPRAAPGPCTDDNRGNGNGSKARDQGHFVLRILRNMHLAPASQGRRPAGQLTSSQECKELIDGV